MDKEKKIEMTYSLTLLQRLLNPREVFLHRCFGPIILVICLLLSTLLAFINLIACLCFMVLGCLIFFFWRSFIWDLVKILSEHDSSQYICISPKGIGYGKKTVEGWISLESIIKVEKGEAGTSLIRFGSKYTLIVPKNVILLPDLKKAILEMNIESATTGGLCKIANADDN